MAKKKSDSEDNAIPVSVALRPSQLQKIERFRGYSSRSDYIRNAVDYALDRAGDDYEERIENSIKNFLDHHWFENALYPLTIPSNSGSRFPSNLAWAKTEERMREVIAVAPPGASLESVFPSDILDWLNIYMRNLEGQWEALDEEGRVAFVMATRSGYKHLKEKYGAM